MSADASSPAAPTGVDSPLPLSPRERLRELLRLAWPMVLAQAAFLGMVLTDTLVAGRFSAEALAGVSLGSAVIMPGYNLLMGLCLAIAPAMARQLGAGVALHQRSAWIGGAARLALGCWIGLMVLLQCLAAPVAQAIAPDAQVAAEMRRYLHTASAGLPFLGLFFVLRNVLEAHGISRPAMWWGGLALLLNVPLDIALVNGIGPVPALGAAGCGIATALIQLLLAAALWRTVRRHRRTQDLRFGWVPALPLNGEAGDATSSSAAAARDFARLGLPIGFALLAESSLFALGGLLMARYGTAAVGAHQIAVSLAAMVFMMQVGIGQATAVLVSRALGAGDMHVLRLTARLGVIAGLLLASVVSIVFVVFGSALVNLFTTAPDVRAFGAVFMLWAAIFHLADAMQAIHAAALRGLHRTREVMVLTLAAYGGVSIPLMLYLTFVRAAPANGIWWAFTAGLAVAAALLIHRFWSLARHPAGRGLAVSGPTAD